MGRGDKDHGGHAPRNGRAKRPLSWAKLGGIVQSKLTWLLVGISGAAAGTVTFIHNFEEIKTNAEKHWQNHVYLQSLHRPHPEVLKEAEIAKWKSGDIGLAQFQIDGYLGLLTDGPNWVKLCLTSSGIFSEKQFNDRLKLDETFVDRQNKMLLQRRLDRIDLDKEEDQFLEINDPFLRLLERSSIQLLSRYQKSELSSLDGAQLYLLRNAISARHGYRFRTAKLIKYQNRMGWGDKRASFTPQSISKVERCNAFLLQELHSATELGALGRGVLIREPKGRQIPRFLRAALCTCLGQPKTHVDCRESPDSTNEAEFHDYVDLIIEFVVGDSNLIAWTFIDEKQVVEADRASFHIHQHRFYSAALDFNAAFIPPLQAKKIDIKAAADSSIGAFWGVQVALDQPAVVALTTDPALSREVAQKMCAATRDAFEQTGPYLPRVQNLSPAASSIGEEKIEILSKPIVFDGRRTDLTRKYLRTYDGISGAEIELVPQGIVVHTTGTNTLQRAFETYNPVELPAPAQTEGAEPEVNLSVHYLVDREGGIYSLMKDFDIARHVPGVNRFAIAIANVGDSNHAPTQAQLSANVALVRFLKRRYKQISWVASASDLSQVRKLPIWEEKQADPALQLRGPDESFMSQLRARVADLLPQ
jgi:N-acetylmuramoyl-L-alanine amidase